VLAPQCPLGCAWPGLVDQVLQVIKQVMADNPVDVNRVYITGVSVGAFGAWAVAAAQPDLFAAIVPIAGGFARKMPETTSVHSVLKLIDSPLKPDMVKAVQRLPAWIFHGARDHIVNVKGSKAVHAALRRANPKHSAELTVYPSLKHDSCWKKAYKNAELFKWLLQQVRQPEPEPAPELMTPAKDLEPELVTPAKELPALLDAESCAKQKAVPAKRAASVLGAKQPGFSKRPKNSACEAE